jgi:hypothetical protein
MRTARIWTLDNGGISEVSTLEGRCCSTWNIPPYRYDFAVIDWADSNAAQRL